ncbi:hypothetical protein A6R68_22110, partial [Neotoma lepida]
NHAGRYHCYYKTHVGMSERSEFLDLMVTASWSSGSKENKLSLIDISLATITIPQMLVHTLSVDRSISYNRCMVQLFFFMAVGSMEVHLLAAMAYDRYVAICDPLRYSAI